MNLACLLDHSAVRCPERAAVVCEKHVLSYGGLASRTSQLARGMLSSGLKSQSHVAILSSNGPFFVESYFAAVRAGLVAVLVNTRLSDPEIIYILNDAQAEALFYEAVYHEMVERIRGKLEKVRLFVSSNSAYPGFAVD